MAGGTWIGLSDKKRLVCLLNGGYEIHEREASYRVSRGVIVKEVLKSVHAQKIPKIRKFVSYTAITINLSMLVVSGYFASAVVVLISLIMHAHLYSEVDKHLTDIAE